MPGLFKEILVPVDFSVNTEIAVKQAVELACTDDSIIHLLHIKKPKTIWHKVFASFRPIQHLHNRESLKSIKTKLQQWKETIKETIPNSQVNSYVRAGKVEYQIQKAAKELNPHLIIIGKKANSKLFNFFHSVCPNSIAKSTGCPVLSVIKRTIDNKIKIIVIPVSSFVPKRKIELVVEFAKKYRAEIHLITIPNKINIEETNSNSSFLETYRILKTSLTNPIEYHILKGNNLAIAILEYAECVKADLIFVNPGTETKISSITGKHINDSLESSSRLKILSIEPYRDHKLTV